jgi:hypothetical protein
MTKKRNSASTNEKRTKLIKELAKGKNVSEAGRAAGYSAPQAAHRALSRMRIYLPEILARLDLSVEKVLMKFKDQLEAKETKFFAHEGIVVDSREVVAHDIQHLAADKLAKIYGLYPHNGHDQDTDRDRPGRITIQVAITDSRTAETLMGLVSALSANRERPVLDATPHEDQGRAGQPETTQIIP